METTTPTRRAPRPTRRARWALAGGTGLALTLLGVALWPDEPAPDPAATHHAAAPATTAAPAPTTAPAPASPPTSAPRAVAAAAPATLHPAKPKAVLPDGRHPVFLTDIDAAGSTVQFDLVQYLATDAERERYEAAHPTPPGEESEGYDEGPIRNDNPRLRRMPVAPGAVATVQSTLRGQCAGAPATLGFAALAETVRARDDFGNGFWLTVRNGAVVALDEMPCAD